VPIKSNNPGAISKIKISVAMSAHSRRRTIPNATAER
jgi:hypothetical protein